MKYLRAKGFKIPLESKTLVMGILNITPDSFSDGGKYLSKDKALVRARKMVEEGADIIDIGGESTRPQATPVSLEEELERVIPIIEIISQEIDIPISIDTYKSKVAYEAISNGAHIINDVWGAKLDSSICKVASVENVPIVLMHNRRVDKYSCFIDDVIDDLKESLKIAKDNGIPQYNIILDPGIGFAKNLQQNLTIIKEFQRIVDLGYITLIGTSRKSMIGNVLKLPIDSRLEGSLASSLYAVSKGCKIVRVHDVKSSVSALKVLDAIMYC